MLHTNFYHQCYEDEAKNLIFEWAWLNAKFGDDWTKVVEGAMKKHF